MKKKDIFDKNIYIETTNKQTLLKKFRLNLGIS